MLSITVCNWHFSSCLVSADGMIAFSEIQTFIEKEHAISRRYKSITTNLNTTVSLTSNHLIYARKNVMDKFHPMLVHRTLIFLNIHPKIQISTPRHHCVSFLLLSMYCTHFRYAEQISIGNEVIVHQNNELTPAKGHQCI